MPDYETKFVELVGVGDAKDLAYKFNVYPHEVGYGTTGAHGEAGDFYPIGSRINPLHINQSKLMSDYETIKKMFDSADVRYEAGEDTSGDSHTVLTAYASGGKGNKGYPGFFTSLGFDQDGKLLWVGAWE